MRPVRLTFQNAFSWVKSEAGQQLIPSKEPCTAAGLTETFTASHALSEGLLLSIRAVLCHNSSWRKWFLTQIISPWGTFSSFNGRKILFHKMIYLFFFGGWTFFFSTWHFDDRNRSFDPWCVFLSVNQLLFLWKNDKLNSCEKSPICTSRSFNFPPFYLLSLFIIPLRLA